MNKRYKISKITLTDVTCIPAIRAALARWQHTDRASRRTRFAPGKWRYLPRRCQSTFSLATDSLADSASVQLCTCDRLAVDSNAERGVAVGRRAVDDRSGRSGGGLAIGRRGHLRERVSTPSPSFRRCPAVRHPGDNPRGAGNPRRPFPRRVPPSRVGATGWIRSAALNPDARVSSPPLGVGVESPSSHFYFCFLVRAIVDATSTV